MTAPPSAPSAAAPRLRVLLVLAEPPLPQGGAVGRCMVARLRGLRAHGVDVTCLAARQVFSIPGDPPADLPVEVIDVAPPVPGWAARIDRLRAPRGVLARGAFAARVRELARDVDVVHLEEIETAGTSAGVTVPTLMQLHYLVRADRSEGRVWRREFRDMVEIALAERAVLRRYHWLAANSPQLAARLRRRAPGAEVVVVPSCLDPADYPVAPLDGPPIAGMIGNGRWPTTAASVRRLLTRIWPEIVRRRPGARLRLAGRAMHEVAAGLPASGVEVVGEVPSSVPFLRGLSVFLNPLERGTGMKMKTLEALAVGLPIVTTAVGSEGIEAGEGALLAADDATFTAAAVELLDDAAARRQRGAAARAAFERHYAAVPANAALVEIYRRMVSSA